MTTQGALTRLRDGDPGSAVALLALGGDTSDAADRQATFGMARLAAGEWRAARCALRNAVRLGNSTCITALNLALAEARLGDRDAARRILADIVDRAPAWDEPHVRLAELLREDGDREGAAAAYHDALDRNPSRAEALLGLGVLLLREDGCAAAASLLRRCCISAPDRYESWDALGIALLGSRDYAEAEEAFAEAGRLAPGSIEIALRRVGASFLAGTAEAERARLEVATQQDPFDSVALAARGVLLARLGRKDEAIDLLEAAAVLAPDAAVPALELADLLIGTDRSAAAAAALERAIALAPEQWLLRNNRAVVLMRLHRYREARDELETLLAEHGEQPGILCNLSTVLTALGEQDSGAAAARRAAEIEPDMHLAWRSLANALAYATGTTAARMLAISRRASETIARPAPAACPPAAWQPPGPKRLFAPDRRLRVGLLSTTLRTHPVGWLTIAGFEHLEPADFEIVCCAQRFSGDPLARRFRAIASAWHVVEAMDLAAVRNVIRPLELDILIDLSGYGDRGLMGACAQRLAPVQIKWVGMQNHSSGLAEMDWFLTDRWESPAGTEAAYSERLLRLPDGYICYSPPAYAPDVAALPALARGAVTFGCFNNLSKVTPDVIAAWSAILRRSDGARLVVKTHQLDDTPTRDRLRADFARHGVDPARIVLRGSSGHRGLLGEYGDVDIVLDPFPYTGGLTTCEALWMGVPTLTIAGELFSSRHATSHMSNAGLPDWVAADVPDYIEQAVRRAGEIAELAELRAGLRARMKASPLCDAPRFGRSLANALRHAWRERCAG